jgi:DNA helicase-4
MILPQRIRELLAANPAGLFAQEIASRLSTPREEVVATLQDAMGGEVSSDGYIWKLLPSAHADILAELKSLLELRRWAEFDEWLSIAELSRAQRDQVLEWKARHIADKIPSEARPDSVQARILASPARTIRVTARAGSGKTRLLAAAGYFLVKECGFRPEEVLLLAFNRDAAKEIEDRLTRLLAIPAFPGTRTFHALAHGLVRPRESVIVDQGQEVADQRMSLFVQKILAAKLDASLIDEVYTFFRNETAIARSTGAFLIGASAYDFRRVLRHITLGGDKVKSVGEKIIGDFLFEHGIEYRYEPVTPWGGEWYRPDFKLKLGDAIVVWEHWAFDPDAKLVEASRHWPEAKIRSYQEKAVAKRGFWREQGIVLLESHAGEIHDRRSFETLIARRLKAIYPELAALPLAERVTRMKEIHLSKLARWIVQGIQRAQKRGWDPPQLAKEIETYGADSERERLFLQLLQAVFSEYNATLVRSGETDFDSIFRQALNGLNAEPPVTILKGRDARIDLRDLRVCLVDEAQDLSDQFLEALVGLRRINPKLRLILVGDDWQAINRFAGSAVELFTESLEERFIPCVSVTLETNYRSAARIVEAGNRLMAGRGAEALPHVSEPGTIQIAFIDRTWIERRKDHLAFRLDEPFRNLGTTAAFFKTLYQLAIPDLAAGRTVGVLFRTNHYSGNSISELEQAFGRLIAYFGWPEENIRTWRRERLAFSTVHRAKGSQWHTVFVVDPVPGSFPLLQPDALEVFRFFGDTVERAEEDERRLFYVAITRAERRLVFITDSESVNESPYLASFRKLIEVTQVVGTPLKPH